MNLVALLLIHLLAQRANSLDYGVAWQSDNWAYACDFKSNDLSNIKTDSSKCASACASTLNCTHFTWTSYLGGTCWMKSGTISKSNAFYTNDYSMICGILNTSTYSNKLIWADEFYSNQVNTSNWKFETGNGMNGWGNYESQYYTSSNAIIQNGVLKIQAKKETINNFKYTSARLVSRASFKYGIFEARIKLPKGRGTWAAFWLLSDKTPLNWPQDGEIDIMENVGRDPNGIHMNIHCSAYSAKTGNNRGTYTSLVDSDIYHIYKVDWNTDRIKFSIDGIEYFTYYKHMNTDQTWPYDSSFNIILNLAIGGGFGGDIDDSIFPTEMVIDYVRVYSASSETYQSVSIKAKANNKYVCAEDSGAKALIANRDTVGNWETFKLIRNLDNSFSFLSMANGLFVSADNYGKDALIANKATNNQWEKFILTPNPDTSYTIESQANWKFVCADDYGNKPLTANRVETSSWESFYISYNTNAKTTAKTSIPVEYWLSDTINNRMFLKQTSKNLIQDTSNSNPYTIFINEETKYQTIDGFGASLTDSSTWLLKNQLSDTKRAEILEKLFGVTGIRLSLLRQTIGSTDFAWESWSFSDPWGQLDDFKLNSFSLWREDAYIRPVLNQALKVSNGRVKLFASPWSPPSWMKTNKHLFGTLGGSLRTDCYDVYADYFVKYLIENQNRSSEIYGITVQNEPLYEPPKYPGMKMTTIEQINFIKNNLAPKIKNAKLKTKILVYDHNYDTYDYANTVTSELSDYVSGVGFHHYTDKHESSILEYKVKNQNKDIWITEAGFGRWIGSGSDNDQFQAQMSRLIRTTRYWSKGFVMWNVALDEKSHPNIIDDFSANMGLITIRSDSKDSVSFERGFYSLGHFSKFVDPNAIRISTNTFSNDVENVAFLNPDNTIVLVVSNRVNQQRKIKIKWRNVSFEADLPSLAAATFKFLVQ